MTDDVVPVGGVADGRIGVVRRMSARGRGPGQASARRERFGQPGEDALVAEIEAGGVAAYGSEKIRRSGDPRVRRAGLRHPAHARHRIGDERFHGDGLVGDPVDEGGVGAVLQEPADEVGEQGLVRTHRRVDAAGPVELSRSHHRPVERFAHAVQALEFEVAGPEAGAGHLHDGGERLGVVGGELWENSIGGRQQLPGAGEVGDVRVRLAGEDRKIGEPLHLRALDFGVPVGALHETHHQAPVRTPGEIDEPVDHEGAAFSVGLDDEADAVPAGEVRIQGQRLQDVQG